MRMHEKVTATLIAAVIGGNAFAGYTISQGSSAPTYTDRSLNFDEPGGPTGMVSPNAWALSHGITSLQAGDGVPVGGVHEQVKPSQPLDGQDPPCGDLTGGPLEGRRARRQRLSRLVPGPTQVTAG